MPYGGAPQPSLPLGLFQPPSLHSTSLHFIATRHIHMAAVIPIHAGGLIVGAKFAHDRLGETLAYLDRLGIAAVLIGLELTAAVSPSSVPQPAMPAVQLWDRVLNVMDPAPWFTACLVLSILAVFDLIRSHHSNSVVAATLPGAIAGAGYAACRPFIDFVRLTADGRSQLGCPMFFVTAIFAIIALAAFFRTLMSALGRYDNVILLPVLGVAVHTSVMLVDVFYLKLYPTLSAMQCVAFGTGVCVAMVGVGAVARHHLHGRVGSTPIPSPRLKVAGRIH